MKKFLYRVIVLLIFLPLYGAAQVGFNKGGYVTNVPNNSFIYRSVALQPDGKIVAVGRTDDDNGLIARFNTDGSLDQTFNGTGFITNVPNNSFDYYSVALQPDGKIVAVGQTDNNDGLIARFKTNGNLDNTFGNNGVVTNIPNDSFSYSSVAVQADGKIVAVGQTDNNDGLIARFTSLGALDATFNNGAGFINTEGDTNSWYYNSVALQADGKIVAVGATEFEDAEGLIARFNTDGTLDRTFNAPHGFINTEVGTNSRYYYSVALQADGKIVAVGGTDDDDNGLIARFNTDGSLDQTFNGTGFITNVPNNSAYYNSVALQPDGKIVAVGETDDDNGLIARFNTDGTLDTQTFNNGTGFITNVPNNSFDYLSVALQPDGKIVAVGQTDNNDGLIARFLSNGVLDAESNWNTNNYRESANINNISIGLLG